MLRKSLYIIILLIPVNSWAQDGGKTIPFRLINNHIYIQGTLNDTLQSWILLDCGAGSMISEEQAKKGSLRTYAYGQTDGVGNNQVPYQLTDSVSFNLGSIRYTEKRIPVLALKEIENCGAQISVDKKGTIKILDAPAGIVQPIDAVLGDKFFRRFVVKIDFLQQELTLYESSTFHYAGKGERIPLRYSDNHIYVRASIAGQDSLPVAGFFMVDCGSMTGLILNVPFIEKHRLTSSSKATAISLCGIGGNSASMLGTVGELVIGKRRINNPVTLFSQASAGVLTRADVAGSIGNGILREFGVVIFDYAREEMIVE